jgi:branched-chain amino acid transport system ATP-binding protein
MTVPATRSAFGALVPPAAFGLVGGALVCDGVSAFYGRIQVVFDISLSVAPGECLAVLGANGAGKTSLQGAIAGTVRGTGRFTFDGKDISGLSAHRRASVGLSYVPEARRNLFSSMTVRENLDLGLSLSPASAREEILSFLLGMFPILKERMATAAGMLSGGEQQMLAIAVALGRQPAALILDEPSQGLAPAIFDILDRAFAELKKRNIAILLAEQNLAFAAQVADRYIVISHGHKVHEGNKEEIGDHEKIFAAYMGGHSR